MSTSRASLQLWRSALLVAACAAMEACPSTGVSRADGGVPGVGSRDASNVVWDAGSNVVWDAGSDAGSEAGSDAGSEAGSDAGSDAGSEGGSDAGTPAPPIDAGPTGWVNVTPASSPAARAWPGLAFDSARGITVLFGGLAEGLDQNDTWEWNGTLWTQITETGASGSPPIRQAEAMSYDAARGVTVLFGGYQTGTDAFLNDTWEWNGSVWAQLTENGAVTSPSARGATMSYDSARQVTVLFGGQGNGDPQNDTWQWDGARWSLLTANGAPGSPSARMTFALADDSSRGVVVLFGGDDAWEWDGTTWTQAAVDGAAGSPTARWAHALAFDAARGVTVLFGGCDVQACTTDLNDTWEWNGSTWTEATANGAAGSPQGRSYDAMAFDSAREVTVMFGGFEGSSYANDTWEWHGSPDAGGE